MNRTINRDWNTKKLKMMVKIIFVFLFFFNNRNIKLFYTYTMYRVQMLVTEKIKKNLVKHHCVIKNAKKILFVLIDDIFIYIYNYKILK